MSFSKSRIRNNVSFKKLNNLSNCMLGTNYALIF